MRTRRTSAGATLLFWLMFLFGGSILAACMLLPAWMEYRAALQAFRAGRTRVAEMEAQLRALQRQIDAIQNDPAYVERLARRELGINPPGVEAIALEPPGTGSQSDSPVGPGVQLMPRDADGHPAAPDDESPFASVAPPPVEPEILPEVSVLVQRALERYPVLRLFVSGPVRGPLMALAGLMIVSALILLCWPDERRDDAPAESPTS